MTSITCLGALAAPGAAATATSTPVAIDSRCDELQEVVGATLGAVTGDLSDAARHARALRDLSTRELVPDRVKPALRKLARFFEDVPDMSLLERAEALGRVSRPLSKVLMYTATTCGSPVSTTSTTRPLR